MSAPKRAKTQQTGRAGAAPPNSGKTPREAREEVDSIPRDKLAQMEAVDNPADRLVTPVEPRCRNCGATFSTEQELVEHAKTCKGGHAPERLKEHVH